MEPEVFVIYEDVEYRQARKDLGNNIHLKMFGFRTKLVKQNK